MMFMDNSEGTEVVVGRRHDEEIHMMTFNGWVLLLALTLPVVACVQAGAYVIKDSGVPTSPDGAPIWLDNQLLWVAEKSVWDTATGSISPYAALQTLQGTARVCIRGNFISYIRRKPGTDKEWFVVYGKIQDGQIVEEEVTALPNPFQVNPFSCRYYASPPPWNFKGRATTPLLEEHGYIDWGPRGGDVPSDDSHLTLHRPGGTQGVQLPIRRKGLTSRMSYEPSMKAYLIASDTYRHPLTGEAQPFTSWPKGKPFLLWWLTPAGETTEVQIPYAPFMESTASRGFLAVRGGGIFAWSHAIAPFGTNPGDAGGYLFRDGTIRKLVTGLVHRPTVSHDGCRVAFVHDPWDTEFPKDRKDRITVKVIDFCEGGTHG
jgi:hypothetical protein